MKKIITLLFVVVSAVMMAQNGTGKQFPDCSGETFDGKKVNIPAQTKGKVTVIGIAFTQAAEEDLKTWLNPMYQTFVVKKDTSNFFDVAQNYDVNFYFIPMPNQLNQVLENKEKIKARTDKEFWPFAVFYKGEVKPYIEALKIEDKKTPYFFVLDAGGKIIYSTSGRYTDKKMEAIIDLCD